MQLLKYHENKTNDGVTSFYTTKNPPSRQKPLKKFLVKTII